MFGLLFGKFSRDIGIDLGTANTLVYVSGRGIVANEPSVVALNTKTGRVLAVGEEARKMVGKTPGHIIASRPLVDGVISEFEIAEQMLRYFVDKVHTGSMNFFPRPRIVIGVPSEITDVEKRAVEEAATNAGAREVYLIEEPMAAALGARLAVQEPTGHMVVDIGGGTSEITVISLGGIIVSQSLRVAGDHFNDAIIHYARDKHNLLLGERTAEEVKIEIGSALPFTEPRSISMRGRNLLNGLPKEVIITAEEVRRTLRPALDTIITSIKANMEQTPPEVLADVMVNGIMLAGGGSLLHGLDELLEREIQIPVYIAEDPLTAVVRGCGVVLENLNQLKEVLIDVQNT